MRLSILLAGIRAKLPCGDAARAAELRSHLDADGRNLDAYDGQLARLREELDALDSKGADPTVGVRARDLEQRLKELGDQIDRSRGRLQSVRDSACP